MAKRKDINLEELIKNGPNFFYWDSELKEFFTKIYEIEGKNVSILNLMLRVNNTPLEEKAIFFLKEIGYI